MEAKNTVFINIDPGLGCINIIESPAADCSASLTMHSEMDEPSDRN
jgi:hypothetical protein